MRYLFFDIECCDGHTICELGYIFTDENLQILEKNHILINPRKEFNLTGRKDSKDVHLAYSEEEYRNSPTFAEVYDRIASIFNDKDCQVIGFSIESDINYLRRACSKSKKKQIILPKYYDFQDAYCNYAKINSISLKNLASKFEINDLTWHNSVDDAYVVVCALKKVCELSNMTPKEFLKKYKRKKGILHAATTNIGELLSQLPFKFTDEE